MGRAWTSLGIEEILSKQHSKFTLLAGGWTIDRSVGAVIVPVDWSCEVAALRDKKPKKTTTMRETDRSIPGVSFPEDF
jgi:hypothetical protein